MLKVSDLPIETNDEINVLDLLLVVVQNLRLLVLGPLAAGLLALASAFALTPVYESVSILRPDLTVMNADGNSIAVLSGQEVEAMANGFNVLDALIDANPSLKAMPRAAAHAEITALVDAKYNVKTKLLTLTTRASNPAAAQKLNHDVLNQLYAQSQAKGPELEKINQQTQQLQSQLAANQNMLQKLQQRMDIASSSANLQDITQGYAQIQIVLTKLQSQLAQLEATKSGLTASALVQDPTLPAKSVKPKKALIAILATLASGFALLLFVFVRQALRNGAQDMETAQTLASITASWRKALGKA